MSVINKSPDIYNTFICLANLFIFRNATALKEGVPSDSRL